MSCEALSKEISISILCLEFEALMHKKFQMSAMGELNFFLGLQVMQKEDGIFLSQDKYIGYILKQFGFSDVRSSNTFMDKENTWGKDGTRKDVDLHLYRSMIGSLMYLTASRPDIMFVVYACARHQVIHKECYLHAVKRIFRYLKGHHKLGLWYPKASPFDLVAFSDSDYGGKFQYLVVSIGMAQEVEILRLKEREQVLEDREGVAAKHSGDDAPIMGRSINEGDAANERISNDSEDVARVLTS
nr:uncharacterized mitochondrial protein AtMg00810-like [Tanacetum cinerariifolium]